MAKFELLNEKGLPNPLVINKNLMTQVDCNKNIRAVAKEQVITSSMKGMPAGKVLYKTFENLFYL